jgi:hypothetical protein
MPSPSVSSASRSGMMIPHIMPVRQSVWVDDPIAKSDHPLPKERVGMWALRHPLLEERVRTPAPLVRDD